MPLHNAETAGSPVVPAVAADSKTQIEWEYEVVEDLGKDPKARLNELGKEGWALVTANPYIFRRPRNEDKKTRGPVGFMRE